MNRSSEISFFFFFLKSNMFSVTFKVLHCNVALNHLHVTVSQQILVINLPINSAGTHSLSLCLAVGGSRAHVSHVLQR